MSTTEPTTAPEAGSWIIDADGHVVESDDIWERFLPERYRGIAPRLAGSGASEKTVDPHGEASDAVKKLLSIAGGTSAPARLPDMDVDLIERAALFPTLGILIQTVKDREASVALHRAVNDWMAEYASTDNDRLLAVGVIPSSTADDAITEARRCIEERGFRAVFRRPDVPPGQLAIHDPSFEPLWAYLEAADIPIVCHSGSPPDYYVQRFPHDNIAVHAMHFVAEAMMALASFTLFGILERHPSLRVGLVECGATWVLGACHRLDEHVEKASNSVVHYALPAALSLEPSEYFRRQCFVTTEEFEPGLGAVLDLFPDNVMFATDYPHPDGVFPGSTAQLLHAPELTEARRRAVLRDNALRLYGLTA